MFKFTFDFTEQDYIDFNIFFTRHMAKNRLEKLVVYGLPILPLLYLMGNFLGEAPIDPIKSGLDLVWTFVFYMLFTRKKAYNKIIAKRTRKFIEGKGKEHTFGTRTITFTEEYFLDHTAYEENKVKYTMLAQIKEADHGIYLFVTPVLAVILPNRVFSSEKEKRAFLDFIHAKLPQTE